RAERGVSGAKRVRPRARHVIQIFAAGGVSHIDTFQHKDALRRHAGATLPGENKGFFGQPGKLMPSPFSFRRYGECGQWVSEIFPSLATTVDRISFIHSMVAKSN